MAIWIGIDPGEHTGVAVWDSAAHCFVTVKTLALHRALELVRGWQSVAPRVIFEDARQRRWFPRERNASEYRGRLMGAGAAKRDAAIWEEFLKDSGIQYEARKPQAGATKWTPEYFARVTGYTGRTSEHARDAAVLVYGR